jgi:hypothetical protein
MRTKSIIYIFAFVGTIALASCCDTQEGNFESYSRELKVEQNEAVVGLSRSLLPSKHFESYRQHENDRSFHSDIAFYETVLSYGPCTDPNPVFFLANAYIATNQQNYGVSYFEAVLDRFRLQMTDEVTSNYLSAYALLRASYADNVGLISEIG